MVSPQVAPTKAEWRPEVGTIYVYDPSPLNWLFTTWNTMEEPIRVDQDGRVVNALATGASWPDDHTLELELRTMSSRSSTRCSVGSLLTHLGPG
jgi:hypothetical protein